MKSGLQRVFDDLTDLRLYLSELCPMDLTFPTVVAGTNVKTTC